MALHRIGHKNAEGTLQAGQAWNEVCGTPTMLGSAKPGDIIELIPGTHIGQKFTINVSSDPGNPIIICVPPDATEPAIIDGQYKYPTGKAARTGPDGDMVFGALLDIRTPGVKLGNGRLANGQCGIVVEHSRGRGIQFGKDEKSLAGGELDGVEVRSNRNTNIMARYVVGFNMRRCNVHRASDYYQAAHDPEISNFPGAVVLHGCEGGVVERNRIHETWSDGLMLTMGTKGISVLDNELFDIAGNASLYFHGAEDWIAARNLIYNTGRQEWQHSQNPFDGAMGIVCNNEEEAQFASLAVRNGRAENNILLNLGIGIWRNEGANRAIEDVHFIHNTVVCHGSSRPLKVAQKTGPRSVWFEHNLFYHPAGVYGDIVDWEGITLGDNGWGGGMPIVWDTTGDFPNVPLFNPDAPLTAFAIDVENYRPTQPCGFGVDTGVEKDYTGHARKFWTVGALEWQQPIVVPPPTEQIGIMLSMDVPADKAEMIRGVLSTAKFTVN